MQLRSMLYAPGNQERKLQRVFDFGADGIIFDLEDAVPHGDKDDARRQVRVVIQARAEQARAEHITLAVRLNAWRTGMTLADLKACVISGVSIVKPTKITDPQDLVRIDGALSYIESELGLPLGAIEMMPELDIAFGILELPAIATASPRIKRVQFGGGNDFCNDLGIEPSDSRYESEWARQYIVLVSRRYGLEPPLHGSVGFLESPEKRLAVLDRARTLGYQGATCIHPHQVEATNSLFTISQRRIDNARATVAAYRDAEADHRGTLVMPDGRFVDEAHLRGAVQLLARIEER